MNASVENHYGVVGLGESILMALAADGKDVANLTADDLAPVDGFHIRGRAASRELAADAGIARDHRVLDVGSGLGGSARFLASEYGCHVTGIDATRTYCDVATMLSRRIGLAEQTTFHHGNALSLPFDDASFDVAWTEHTQMNIAEKEIFYDEIARVLKPGGKLLFHDIFQGPGGEPHFPVPWAEDASISHLAAPEDVRAILESRGLAADAWTDGTDAARAWIDGLAARTQRPQTGIHLLMGATAPDKFANLRRNLHEDRIAVVQAVLRT